MFFNIFRNMEQIIKANVDFSIKLCQVPLLIFNRNFQCDD